MDDSFSQKTFADSLGLPFPLLSDRGGQVTQLYSTGNLIKAGTDLSEGMQPGHGVTLKKDRLLSDQAFFLIDKEGILRGRWLPGVEEAFSNEHILNLARDLAKP